MLFTRKRQCRFLAALILFALTNFSYIQSTTSDFRSSNIEIIPNEIVIDSTSITNFLCINHAFDNARLEANITQLIPSNQMKISTNLLNKTAMNIRLESNNYVGIFHLLCYANGQRSNGNQADVYVKAAPGVLQLIDRCRVYDKQYIKCIIRASVIARAIQNGYSPRFEFDETSHPSDQKAYIEGSPFVKNESTNEYLVFKWRPTVEGEFPNRVQMHMKQMLSYFNESSYYFDMTPVFVTKPNFTSRAISSSEILIQFTRTSSTEVCEKSIVSQLISNINQTWTLIEPVKHTITVNNLLSDTMYHICIKCRQQDADPIGLVQCEEIKTLSRINTVFIILMSIVAVILILIIGIISYALYKRHKYSPVPTGAKKIPNIIIPNRYDIDPSANRRSNVSLQSENQASAPTHTPSDSDTDDPSILNQIQYRSIGSVLDASFPHML